MEVIADRVACVAFPADAAAEMHNEGSPILETMYSKYLSMRTCARLSTLKRIFWMPCLFVGTSVDEAERRRAWTALPLRVRTAIRRMHRQFGHPSPTVLVQVLRAARAPPEYIQACRHFRCDACEETKPKPQSTKVALPKDYVFGRNLGIDVLEVKDIAGEPYLCFNILDLGTTIQQVVLLRQGHGSPSSRECLDSFVSLWVGWADWPQTLSCDRGVHNRGVFARALAPHEVLIRQAGVESPEQIGRVERHGGLFKAVLKRMVTDHAVQGFDDMKVAVAEAVSTKYDLSRNGGCSPSQWVFGTLPRGPGDQFDEQEFADLGPLKGQLEPGTAFARRAELRASARRAFIRENCGRRVARAVLRKAAPLIGEYATGDIVCYRKNDQGWSSACRLVGFDGNKTAWLICARVPVCAAVDSLRPATSAEALAMQFEQNVRYEPGHPEDQQAFVDARAPLDHDEDEPAADPPEDRPTENPEDPETPRSEMEQEFEHGNTPPRTRPRSSEDPLDDSPFALRRRVRFLHSNWISHLESYGRIRAPRLLITGGAEALPDLELALSNDNKTARGTRQTRWSLFTLIAEWATSIDQRREARVPKTSVLRPLTSSRKQVWSSLARLSGSSGNSSMLCMQYRDPNWNNCWPRDTSQSHSSGSKSIKMSTNGAKVVLMSHSCSKVD